MIEKVTYERRIPLLTTKEGWTRQQEDAAKPPLKGADGVVAYTATRLVSDHPVCAISVASRHFITGAATPPSQGGE